MKLSIVGTGYVGLVSGTCFAEMGNTVYCVDTDAGKIDRLKKGIIPIYEPGLDELVNKNYKNGNLHFTTEIKEALEQTDIIFIAVGTPTGEDGSADLHYVLQVAKSIGQFMNHDIIIVDKSTVPVGTADLVKSTVQKELDARKASYKFFVVSNPEFLKEGAAIDDCMKPDRVVVGTDDEKPLAVMKELYAPFTNNNERLVAMDIKSAEMTKYTANAMLATKISFMNEIANICEKLGADVNMVRAGIGSDSRIGFSFINPGTGYGGSCFPKDVKALIRTAEGIGYNPRLIQAVEDVNDDQKLTLVKRIVKRFGTDLRGYTFCLWGLAFKPGTDDMREAPAIYIVRELAKMGAKIQAHDPKAEETAKNFYLKGQENIEYFSEQYAALAGADAMIMVTEWKEFKNPDFSEIKRQLKNPVIFDGRNQYDSKKLKEMGFEYYQVGVGE